MRIKVQKNGKTYPIDVFFDKEIRKYRWVNLAKKTISPCKFDTEKDAFLDFVNNYILERKYQRLMIDFED